MSDEKSKAGFTPCNIQATAAMVEKLGLCTHCGAVLPLGHPKSVITCPGCGAKSLPQPIAAVPDSPEWERLQAKYGDPEREEWAERTAQRIAAAHAAGVAEERARWEGWLKDVERFAAERPITIAAGLHEAVFLLRAHVGDEPPRR